MTTPMAIDIASDSDFGLEGLAAYRTLKSIYRVGPAE